MKLRVTNKLHIRPSLAGAAILAVIVLHFVVSQFISFESRKESSVAEVISQPDIEISTEYEAKKLDVAVAPKVVQAAPVTSISQSEANDDEVELKRETVKQPLARKKEPRESRAERLRRAEKLLTGV